MERRQIAICCALCYPSFLCALEWNDSLRFDALAHDFGTVFSHAQYSHRFRFRNVSAEVVNIASIMAPCKCAAVMVGDRSVQPQEWGYVECTLKTEGLAGAVRRTVKMGLDEARAREVVLTLKANVIPQGIHVKPPQIIFGNVSREPEAGKAVRVRIVTADGLTAIAKLSCSVPWIAASARRIPTRISGKLQSVDAKVSVYDLHLALDARKAPSGFFLEFLTIYTDSVRWTFRDVPIKGKVCN